MLIPEKICYGIDGFIDMTGTMTDACGHGMPTSVFFGADGAGVITVRTYFYSGGHDDVRYSIGDCLALMRRFAAYDVAPVMAMAITFWDRDK